MTLTEARELLKEHIALAHTTTSPSWPTYLDSYFSWPFAVSMGGPNPKLIYHDVPKSEQPQHLVQAAELYAAYILGPKYYDNP